MNDRDRIALEHWQSTCEGRTERKLKELVDVVDDLTTYNQDRAGAHILMANRSQLIEAMRKLRDLVLDTAPALAAELVD